MQQLRKILITSLVVIFGFTTFVNSVTQDEIDQLERQKDELLDSIEGGKERIEELERTIEEINENIKELDVQIKDIEQVIEGLEIDREYKEKEIEVTSKELQKALEEEVVYRGQILERIKIMYEYGEVGYFEVLLESKDIGDFFNRLEYLSKIFEYDEKMMENLQGIHEEIEAKETLLEIEKVVLEEIIVSSNAQKNVLEDLSVAKRIEMARVDNDKELHTLQIAEWETLDEEIGELIEEKKLEMKYQFKDGDTFSWPTPGYYTITSPFGTRIHPTTGVYSMHNGIDIAASYGSEVLAAATGIVIMAEYYGSYGNLVIIDHGGGYYTYYAHNTRLYVSEDDEVLRGDTIALIGSTGRSTGPHLHFGVKKDGVWQNPIDYFE